MWSRAIRSRAIKSQSIRTRAMEEPSDQEPSDQEPSDREPSDQEPSDRGAEPSARSRLKQQPMQAASVLMETGEKHATSISSPQILSFSFRRRKGVK